MGAWNQDDDACDRLIRDLPPGKNGFGVDNSGGSGLKVGWSGLSGTAQASRGRISTGLKP